VACHFNFPLRFSKDEELTFLENQKLCLLCGIIIAWVPLGGSSTKMFTNKRVQVREQSNSLTKNLASQAPLESAMQVVLVPIGSSEQTSRKNKESKLRKPIEI
jgi:hypothetical protein